MLFARVRRTVREDPARRLCVQEDAAARSGPGSETAGGSGCRRQSACRRFDELMDVAHADVGVVNMSADGSLVWLTRFKTDTFGLSVGERIPSLSALLALAPPPPPTALPLAVWTVCAPAVPHELCRSQSRIAVPRWEPILSGLCGCGGARV